MSKVPCDPVSAKTMEVEISTKLKRGIRSEPRNSHVTYPFSNP